MGEFQLSAQQLTELAQVGDDALAEISEVYGCGFPGYQRLGSEPLAYHNEYHGFTTKRGTGVVGAEVGLSASELAVAEAGAAAHDVKQLLGIGVNEAESVAWLARRLQRIENMPPAVATVGGLAIYGTIPIIQDGKLVGQKASVLEYPTRSAELIVKSVACGDFSEIYTPEGPYLGHRLYQEFSGCAPNEEPPMDGLFAFQQNQAELVDTFEYLLPEANTVLATHRSEVARYTAYVLGQAERGEIHTFGQLIDQDLAFRNSLR